MQRETANQKTLQQLREARALVSAAIAATAAADKALQGSSAEPFTAAAEFELDSALVAIERMIRDVEAM